MERPQKESQGQYARLKHLLETGFIKEIHELFPQGERKALLLEMAMSHKTLRRRLAKPETFGMDEIVSIADALGVNYIKISDLVYKAMMQAKKKKGKR